MRSAVEGIGCKIQKITSGNYHFWPLQHWCCVVCLLTRRCIGHKLSPLTHACSWFHLLLCSAVLQYSQSSQLVIIQFTLIGLFTGKAVSQVLLSMCSSVRHMAQPGQNSSPFHYRSLGLLASHKSQEKLEVGPRLKYVVKWSWKLKRQLVLLTSKLKRFSKNDYKHAEKYNSIFFACI